MNVVARPLESASGIGVRVSCVSRESLSDSGVHDILRAMFRDHGLIVLEDVEPDDATQVAVSQVFGAIKDYSAAGHGLAAAGGNRYVAVMADEPNRASVVEINGERLAGWLPWHFDQCYNQTPNRGRVLRCAEGVSTGGMTGFIDGVQLYERLSPELRELVETLVVNYRMNMALENLSYGIPERFRVINDTPRPPPSAKADALPRASHPAVRTSWSGARLLHMSPWMAVGVEGCDEEASHTILERLAREIMALSSSIAYFHEWRARDMVIWDNMRMLHSASGFSSVLRRVMCRTTIMAD